MIIVALATALCVGYVMGYARAARLDTPPSRAVA